MATPLGFDLRRHADAVMETLMQETGETIHLPVLDQRDVVYDHKIDSENPVSSYLKIGGQAAADGVSTG